MAIINKFGARSLSYDGKMELTLEEFKKWLKKFDADKDGRLSGTNIRDAVRATGGQFSTWKAFRGLKSADANRNGFIDIEQEFENLVTFAEKHLRLKIVQP